MLTEQIEQRRLEPGHRVDCGPEVKGLQAATSGVIRFQLGQLLNTKDSWLLVEAGVNLPGVYDPDDDGLPDLYEPNVKPGRTLSDYVAIVPNAWPLAFTNPFLIDVDGNGWQAPGLTP